MNKLARFTWDEWKWMIIIIMLGINMYWTSLLIQPANNILTQNQAILNETIQQTQKAGDNVKKIIENQNRAAEMTRELVNKTEMIEEEARDAFFELQLEHENTTKAIRDTQNAIKETQEAIIQLQLAINNNVTVIPQEEERTAQILANLTAIRDAIVDATS